MQQDKTYSIISHVVQTFFNNESGKVKKTPKKYRLDGFDPACLTRVINDLKKSDFESLIDFKIPENLVNIADIECKSVLIKKSAAWVRNEPLPQTNQTKIVLTANSTADSSLDTLNKMPKLDASLLTAQPGWLDGFKNNSLLDSDNLKSLECIFNGLHKAGCPALTTLESFLLHIQEDLESRPENDRKLDIAVNNSLPILGFPKALNDISKMVNGKADSRPWRTFFGKTCQNRSRYFSSESRPSNLSNEDLSAHLAAIDSKDEDFAKGGLGSPHDLFSAAASDPKEGPLNNLINLDWDRDYLKEFLEGVKVVRTKNLGELTLRYFRKNANQHLASTITVDGTPITVENLLIKLKEHIANKVSEIPSEFYQFYYSFQDRLSPDLIKEWEKFLHADKIVSSDFMGGLLTGINRLLSQESIQNLSDFRVRVKYCHGMKHLHRKVNKDVLTYFRFIAKGLKKEDSLIYFQTNFQENYNINPFFEKTQDPEQPEDCVSSSKEALSLEFILSLVNSKDKSFGDVRLEWNVPKDSLIFLFTKDIAEIENKLDRTILSLSNRSTNTKGTIGSVSLDNPSSLGSNLSEGLYRLADFNLKAHFDEECRIQNIGPKHSLYIAWNSFFESWKQAIADFKNEGFAASSIKDQYKKYIDLLLSINELRDNNSIRKTFYGLISSIGVYSFKDIANSYAIVPPWNPLRFYSLHCRFISRLDFIRSLLRENQTILQEKSVIMDHLTDPDPDYFDPQAVIMPSMRISEKNINALFSTNWKLLTAVQHSFGYSLYNIPCNHENYEWQDIGDYKSTLKSAKDAISTYLQLFPHEITNFNIFLPDVCGSTLPVKLSKQIFNDYIKNDGTSNSDARFILKVGGISTQSDKSYELYEELTNDESLDNQQDFSNISQAIGSSLRIQVNYDTEIKDRSCHIALIDKLLTDHAQLKWQRIPLKIYDPLKLDILPELQNKRYFDYKNSDEAKTFLVTPVQTEGGALYLRTIACKLPDLQDTRVTDPNSDLIALPALYISIQDKELSDTLHQIHDSSDWVIICNNLIDKRQLMSKKIDIVRYKMDRTNNRTEIISSTFPADILERNISNILFNIFNNSDPKDSIIKGLIRSSYQISGYLALRAARQDNNARELTGVTLSRSITERHGRRICKKNGEEILISPVYLLDDYCNWFELLELDSLADLLALFVTKDSNDRIHLHIVITESKFINFESQKTNLAKSKKQLLVSVNHVVNTLKKNTTSRLNRTIWLNRLADLIQDTPDNFHSRKLLDSNQTFTIGYLVSAIRNDEAIISVDGYSHVFTYDIEYVNKRDFISTSDNRCCQDVYSKESIRTLLKEITDTRVDKDLLSPEINAFTPVDPQNDPSDSSDPSSNKISIAKSGPCTPEQTKETVVIENTSQPEQIVSSTEVASNPDKVDSAESSEIQTMTAKEPDITIEDTVEVDSEAHINEIALNMRYAPGFEAVVNAKAVDNGYSEERQKWADDACVKLRTKLILKSIRADEIDHTLTPNGCLVRYRGHESLDTKAIKNLEENLLTTDGLEIIFAHPAPGEFQILLKTPDREAISMWSIWKRRTLERNCAGVNLNFAIGLKEIDNGILYLNPVEQDPHTLVAGGTGSGKTVLVQMLLLDIAATNPSNKMKFYLIDPKGAIDYIPFKKLPHLASPFIIKQPEAQTLIQEVLATMNERLELFREVGAKNLELYNAKVSKDKQLPVLWLVHDEFAAWMIDKEYADMISTALTQLTVQARATGIYLVIIAQRPDNIVMPMQIRDNLGNRLALKLPTEQSSTIALGEKGAEVLLGQGHMAAKLSNIITYAQAPFLNEKKNEVEEAIDYIAKYDKQWN